MSEEAARQVSVWRETGIISRTGCPSVWRFDEVNIRPRASGFYDNRLEFRFRFFVFAELVPKSSKGFPDRPKYPGDTFPPDRSFAKEAHADAGRLSTSTRPSRSAYGRSAAMTGM